MKTQIYILSAVLVLSVLQTGSAGGEERQAQTSVSGLASVLPAVFVENAGQVKDESVRYLLYGSGANMFHTTKGLVFQLLRVEEVPQGPEQQKQDDLQRSHNRLRQPADPERFNTTSWAFSMRPVGAKQIRPVGADMQQTLVNYYIGNSPNQWRKGVKTYSRVVYPDLYEGIALHTFGTINHLKYEFRVSPGADYSQIVIDCEGVEGLSIDEKGALHIITPLGEIIDDTPCVYQIIDGHKTKLAAKYNLIDKTRFKFQIEDSIDCRRELVIDPNLAWGSYLGGTDEDLGHGIAIDNLGNVFLVGGTWSTDFPTPGSGSGLSGACDVFVAKVTSTRQLAWVTLLGGHDIDRGMDIVRHPSGNIWLTGETYSVDFPVPNGFDTSFNGYADAFVAMMTESGQLVWASFLGGTDCDYGCAIDVSYSYGTAFLTGYTESADFPTLNGWDTILNNDGINDAYDAFIAKVTPAGQLVWSTYLGGSEDDYGYDIHIARRLGVPYPMVVGTTYSADFPTQGGLDMTYNGNGDAFMARVNDSGVFYHGTFLGGSQVDDALAVVIDLQSGDAIITGDTNSPDFLPMSGGFDTSYNGGFDAFIVRLFASKLRWASFLGGSDYDIGFGIALDSQSRDIVLTGQTCSSNFPTLNGFDTTLEGASDAFVTRVTGGGQLSWSSFLGGSIDEGGEDIEISKSTNVYVTGWTTSGDFPTRGGFDTTPNGYYDAFVARIVGRIGDFNGDGKVDFSDFAEMAQVWLTKTGEPNYDAYYDISEPQGTIDQFDLDRFVDDWLTNP